MALENSLISDFAELMSRFLNTAGLSCAFALRWSLWDLGLDPYGDAAFAAFRPLAGLLPWSCWLCLRGIEVCGRERFFFALASAV